MKVTQVNSNGITPRQLMANVPRYIRYHGGFVKITSLKEVTKKGIVRYMAKTRTSEYSQPPRTHTQVITILDGVKLSDPKTRIKVQCTCEWHMYTCEAALFRIGAADIIYSNGDKPMITNPSMVPSACKHVFKILELAMRRKL